METKYNEIKRIKPVFPYLSIAIAIIFICISILFLTSSFFNWKMLVASVIFGSFGLGFLLLTDFACLAIYVYPDSIKFKGCFSIRKFDIKVEDIIGYEIQQKIDKVNGVHEEVQLVLKGQKKIILPKIAYSDYEEVKMLIASRFKFIGYNKIKYAYILARLIPLMGIISGVLAALVGIIKFIK